MNVTLSTDDTVMSCDGVQIWLVITQIPTDLSTEAVLLYCIGCFVTVCAWLCKNTCSATLAVCCNLI